jgi:hypothetical protein
MSMDESDLREVRITTTGHIAHVFIDGRDMAKSISGYTIQHQANTPPLVVIQMKQGGDPVLFEGMAQVAMEQPAVDLTEFLTSIDGDALARAALKRDDLDCGPNELTRAALRQLVDWAQGKM